MWRQLSNTNWFLWLQCRLPSSPHLQIERSTWERDWCWILPQHKTSSKTSRQWPEMFLLYTFGMTFLYSLSHKHPITAHHWSLLPTLLPPAPPGPLFRFPKNWIKILHTWHSSWSPNRIRFDHHLDVLVLFFSQSWKCAPDGPLRSLPDPLVLRKKKELTCQYSFCWKEKRWFICGHWLGHTFSSLSFSPLTLGQLLAFVNKYYLQLGLLSSKTVK